jgi:Holliday junction resolvase RusA-like endonuclease
MPIPKSTPKKRLQELILSPHVKRGDLDNLVKALADALNGVAYEDDSQIYSLKAKKLYSQEPGIEFVITDEIEKSTKKNRGNGNDRLK